jgi:hypothetical protein
MFEKTKNHGVKILVFAINILLAAIAVFVIREKDRARLEENFQKEKDALEKNNPQDVLPPSFESSVSVEEQQGVDAPETGIPQDSNSDQTLPATNNTVIPPTTAPIITTPTVPASSQTKTTKPADRKTKTS